MYFWDVDALATAFREKQVREWDRFRYYLLIFILGTGLQEISQTNLSGSSFQSIQESIAVLVISIFGAWFCYQVNQAGDNEDFLGRVLCLSLPITIRLLLYFSVIHLMIASLAPWFGQINLDLGPYLDTTLVLCFTLATQVWLYLKMKHISTMVKEV
jgi:hypothetical protein